MKTKPRLCAHCANEGRSRNVEPVRLLVYPNTNLCEECYIEVCARIDARVKAARERTNGYRPGVISQRHFEFTPAPPRSKTIAQATTLKDYDY